VSQRIRNTRVRFVMSSWGADCCAGFGRRHRLGVRRAHPGRV